MQQKDFIEAVRHIRNDLNGINLYLKSELFGVNTNITIHWQDSKLKRHSSIIKTCSFAQSQRWKAKCNSWFSALS